MKKIKKLRKKRIISLILLVCLITITLTFAIYRESISKLLNLNIIHPSYTVTFDANGGSVSSASKSVTYKHQYGELPTPTRDEYQFKGWNGKNLFDYQEILKNNSNLVTQIEFNGVNTISWVNNSDAEKLKFLQGYFEVDKQYIFYGRISSSQNSRLAFSIFYTDGSRQTFDYYNIETDWDGTRNEFFNIQFKSTSGKSIDYISGAWSAGERIYIDINNFMIEQGSTATAYEPYYITSSTEVVQAQDHTLTAIWEENPYTVTFDANGGTVSKASKKVKDGEEYGTLPTPTRDGYTFKGWNGKNMLDLYNRTSGNPGNYFNTSLRNFEFNKYYIGMSSDNYASPGNITTFNLDNGIWSIETTSSGYGVGFPIQVLPSTQYIISNNTFNSMFGISYYDSTGNLISYAMDNSVRIPFTTPSNCSIVNIILVGGKNSIKKFSNIQLEQGSTATPYEPYYITSSTTVVQAQDHTLKAIWEPNTYTVSFNKNDNSASGSMSNISMTYDVSSTLPSNSFTRTGYKFVGWNTKADGSGTTYSDGASVSNLTTTNNDTVTLYAQWQRVNASNVYYSEPEVNCNDVQCMIDELYDMLY